MIQKFIQNKTQVNIYIVNGFCMYGVITDATNEYIVLNNSAMIYKHAISTIRPV